MALNMTTLERAIAIAATAHASQTDKAGQPYVLHPLRVMLALTREDERIVGVLHDVVEDTSVSLTQLELEGFSSEILAAIDALTKRPGETRIQAAARAAKNPIALRVKLADNPENMGLSRLANPTAKDAARLEEYKEVRALLLQAASDAVGTGITPRPPHRSVRAELPHTAPASGPDDQQPPR